MPARAANAWAPTMRKSAPAADNASNISAIPAAYLARAASLSPSADPGR